MLADQTAREAGHAASGPGDRRRRRSRSLSDRAAQILVFVGAAALVLVYALRGGGSYDIVAFEEAGLVIWWVLGLGIGLGLLPRSRPSRFALLLLGALSAYAAWTALSLSWTDSSELTTEELARALDYLGLVALVGSVVDRRTWRSAAVGLGFGAMLVCVIAVGSRLAPSLFGSDQIDLTFHIDRLSYPFGYWNSVAAWGAMCTAIGLGWSAHDPLPLRRAIALGLVPVAGLTTYLTYSRAGIAGIALAVVVVLVLSRNRFTALIHTAVAAAGTALAIVAVRGAPQIAHAAGTGGASTVLGALVFAAALCALVAIATDGVHLDRWRVPGRIVSPLGTIVVLVVVVAGVAVGPKLATRAWHSFSRAPAAQGSADPTGRLSNLSSSRYPLWKSAVKDFQAHPAVGTGAGTFEFWWNAHGTNGEFVRDVHNIWVENMAELGGPGLLLIVAVSIGALALALAVRRRAQRSQSTAAAVAFGAAFVVYLLHASVDWMWESTAVTVLALGGVAVLGARLGKGRLRLGVAVRSALAVIAAVAGIVQLPGLLSTAAIRRSQSAEGSGNARLALSWAAQAVKAESWSASAYEQRGLVLESAGRLAQAAADLNRAISHEPTNYTHWLVLARIETERGQLDVAVRDYDRARQLRPLASVFALAPYSAGG